MKRFPVAILGYACRLPGAPNAAAFWRLLDERRTSIGAIGPDRWEAERFHHPDPSARGFSYSFAAGLLPEPFAFDPTVFGLSPREAEQMDPQQRILLEVTWEALEHAGLATHAVAGTEVGVYVGASSLDQGNRAMADPAAIDTHFMVGNTLSIVSNRLSYAFDLKGPSFTVDTACSSSAVAVAEAVRALSSGRIDTAVVAGVNMLLSPGSFIGFSRAGMLSRVGLCQPFAAGADGYVRAEGAVTFILQRLDRALERGLVPRAVILGAESNSDGRTTGIALPSMQAQRDLMTALYRDLDVPADAVAFVEAHGTGTRAGDPVEAQAIGEALGQRRRQPLPIGSAKSNVGHLEPVAGLVGLLKTTLALEQGRLPASLHAEELNPDIDFAALNLAVARDAVPLHAHEGVLHAGVSSFGFGGSNAHIVVRAPLPAETRPAADDTVAPRVLLVSGASSDALRDLAARYAERFAAMPRPDGSVPRSDFVDLALAADHRRARLEHRLVLPLWSPDLVADLRRCAEGAAPVAAALGRARAAERPVVFVFGGNGSQHPGMGRVAYRENADFREGFDAAASPFDEAFGGSLVETLFADDLGERLSDAQTSQPILFAFQHAATTALTRAGLRPAIILGHSVGEVAAALAGGAVDLRTAATVVIERCRLLATVKGRGTMAVAASDATTVRGLIAELEIPLDVAAVNGPASVSVSGTRDAVTRFAAAAKRRRIAVRALAIEYPFHSALLEELGPAARQALVGIASRAPDLPFVSTVTGERLDGRPLGPDHWWRNMREPVRFADAVQVAADLGGRLFLEIGPRPLLLNPMLDVAREAGVDADAQPAFLERDPPPGVDPIDLALSRAVANGAAFDEDVVLGRDAPGLRDHLPAYPWQHREFRIAPTEEAVNVFGRGAVERFHPLLGSRLRGSGAVWRNVLDARRLPWLSDHRVDGEVVVPAAALVEMAFSAGRRALSPPSGDGADAEPAIRLDGFDIVQALALRQDEPREVVVSLDTRSGLLTIESAPRLTGSEVSLHARGRVSLRSAEPVPIAAPKRDAAVVSGEDVRERAARNGLLYGPAFSRVAEARFGEGVMEVGFAPPSPELLGADRFSLDPTALDGAFQPLLMLADPSPSGERRTFLPVRVGAATLLRPGASPTSARLGLERRTGTMLVATVALYDADGVVAVFEGTTFRQVTLSSADEATSLRFDEQPVASLDGIEPDLVAFLGGVDPGREPWQRPDAWLLMDAATTEAALRALRSVFGEGPLDVAAAVEDGRIHPDAEALAHFLVRTLRDGGRVGDRADGAVLEAGAHPAPDVVLRSAVARFPESVIEARLAAAVAEAILPALTRGEFPTLAPALAAGLSERSVYATAAADALAAAVSRAAAAVGGRALRVTLAADGGAATLAALLPLLDRREITLRVSGGERGDIRDLAIRYADDRRIAFAPGREEAGAFDLLGDDLLIMAGGRPFGGDRDLLGAALQRLRAGGAVLAHHPDATPALEIALALQKGWFSASLSPESPIGRLPGPGDTAALLGSAGCLDVAASSLGDAGMGHLVVARPPVRASEQTRRRVLVTDGINAPGLVARLTAAGHEADVVRPGAAAIGLSGPATDLVIDRSGRRGIVDPTGEDLVEFARLLDREDLPPRRWLLTAGALGGCPGAAAEWSLGRVAINENPGLDLRLVDVPLDAANRHAAAVARVVGSPGDETAFRVTADAVAVQRLGRTASSGQEASAARLRASRPGSLGSLRWEAARRVEPRADEVEVEVAATALNFRDLMAALGALPEDLLEQGFAGLQLGLEFSGTIVRTGPDVAGLRPGDRVFGFAPGAFASHVVTPARAVRAVPDAIASDAAAALPVAFVTAWYALDALARVRPGETVLVQGGAGGVGLAAIQLARRRGATVLATASTPDKAALARLFGASEVFPSRDLGFGPAIRRAHGGVDVVLNSFSGAALQEGLDLLRPFGRFVELGKRDFAANSQLGLRPFAQNRAFFGLDLDQAVAAGTPVVAEAFADVLAGLRDGSLQPLPFEVLDATAGFRLMQSGGHAGKIVVRPPGLRPSADPETGLFAAGAGIHLVTGGTSGFGFETASWLVERGARSLLLASRRGSLDQAAAERVEGWRRAGVEVSVEALDVSNRADLDALVARLDRTGRPIAGVIHAAAVLSDALLPNLDAAAADAVLAPKLRGAVHLDEVLRGRALDYFVVYSSAAAAVGNPGQGAYAAANAGAEAVVRARAARGEPGLAVAWGRIDGTGMVARDDRVRAALDRTVGAGLSSAEALAALGEMLVAPDRRAAPVVVHVRVRGSAAKLLRALRNPTFAGVFGAREDKGEAVAADLRTLVLDGSEADAREAVLSVLAAQVERILRRAIDADDRRRPLTELGLDSLMALELRMDVEQKAAIELPLMSLTTGRSLHDLADLIVKTVRSGDAEAPTIMEELVAQHAPDGVAGTSNADALAMVDRTVTEQVGVTRARDGRADPISPGARGASRATAALAGRALLLHDKT